MTKNVLIITQSFPPLGNIASRRFGFLAHHMEASGWRPWILTMDAEGPLDVALAEERIIRIGRHPQAITPGDSTRISNTTRRGLSTKLDRVRRTATKLGVRLRAVDYTCFTWYREVLSQQTMLNERLPKIDLVLGTFGPAAALWLARRLAREWNVPWTADFRDLAALRPDGRGWTARRLDGRIERHLLRSAAGITTVSPTLAAILAETYSRPTEVIYNGWADENKTHSAGPPLRYGPGTLERGSELDKQDDLPAPYLYYAGRWYPERERAGRLVLDVLAKRPDLRWLIRSLGPTAAEAALQAEAIRRGLADRVIISPPCEPSRVSQEADHALANLVLDDVDCRERWSRGTLTGKLLELVASRPAVLAVTRADSDIGPILQETAKGQVCHDTATLDHFVGQLQNDASSCQGNREAVAQFSKSHQATLLCHFLNQLVNHHPKSLNP